jgi:hypothetical protein
MNFSFAPRFHKLDVIPGISAIAVQAAAASEIEHCTRLNSPRQLTMTLSGIHHSSRSA